MGGAGRAGGTGPEIIIEMLANQNLAVDLKAAARNGRVVIVGSRGQIAIDPRDIMSRELSVTGIMLLGATAAETVRTHSLRSERRGSPK